MPLFRLPRPRLAALAALAFLAACADARAPEEEAPVNLGNFALGHNVVVAQGVQQGPFSRTVTEAEIEAAVTQAVERRLGRYDGGKLYHVGLKVEAYALAWPGIPIVFTPKSVLVVSANVWDDARNVKLTEEPKLLTVFEGVSGATLIGSGLIRNKHQQLEVLSNNMAQRVERWLLENGEWFNVPEDQIPEPLDDDPLAALGGAPDPDEAPAPVTN